MSATVSTAFTCTLVHTRPFNVLRDESEVIYIVICQQFICNADMLFIDVVAKWPGSVHDARILRQSHFFSAFEASPRPVDGTMLADSAYMMREWLMTPYENPATLEQWRYNVAHSSTRRPATKAISE